MSKLKQKKYIASILIVVILLGIIGLFSYGKVDKYKGLVKVNKAKLLSSVINTGPVTSKGTEEIKYNLTYTLDEVEGLSTRDVEIKGKLNSPYARFKEIRKSNITSTLNEDGTEITINASNIRLGEEQSLEIKIQVLNSPNNENIIPEISIKEKTGEYTTVSGSPIKVETNSVEGIVLDENNLPVSNIELSISKNGKEVRRTYTDINGKYVFSDLEEGSYIIKVEEDIYELVSGSETSESNPNNKIKVKEVDKYNVETKKYIENLDLVVNGKKEHYTYKDAEKVIQTVKNAKRISGKIEYKIVIRNKSDKKVEIDEVEDTPGEGLEFKESENEGWKKKDGKIVYELMEGVSLNGKEKREVKLVLSINDTNEIKTYINKLTSKGEIKERVVFVIDGQIKRELEVTEGTVIKRPHFDIDDLDGWYTDSNYTNKYNFSNRVNKDLILYAKTNEEKPKYTVRYIDKNQIIKEEVLEEGEKATAPSNPSKRGYTFNCWKINDSCFDFDSEITENLDLISDYQVITYDITYHLHGGTVSGNPDTYTVETETFTLNNPEKEGYTFIGWTGSNGSTPSLSVSLPDETLEDKEYTANYQINRYQLTIDPKGGSYSGDLLLEEDYGTIVTIPNPEKAGYNFTGWTLTGKGTFNNGIYTFGDGNGKLEANYEVINYDIVYKEITDAERELLSNPTSYTIETEEFTLRNPANRLNEDNEGEIFVGWKEKNSDTPSILITLPDRNDLGNKEYTAIWQEREPDKWNITYNLNGGTVSGNPTEYKRSQLPITLNNPEKAGYTFKGWTGSNGDTPGNVTIPRGTEGDLSYTANYTLNSYGITYDYTSCNLTPEEITELNNRGSYTIEDNNFNLNNPNKYGYVFEGWTGTDLSSKTINVEVDTSKIKKLSYKANCVLDKYDVEFYNMKSNGTYELSTTVSDIEYNTTIPSNKIPTVTLRGYTFKYWSLDKSTEFNLSTPITEDIEVYAVYQKDIYPITYNLDGGTVSGNPESYSVDTEEFTLNNPTKTGYEFTGWTGSCGDSPLKVVTLPEEELGPKEYTANYKINKYKVTYMNGESKHDEEEVEYNKKATGNVETPTKAHNIFKGWTLNNVLYDFDTPVTDDITLYASWEEVEAPTITHTPTTWVGDKVTVTISSSHNDYSYKYKIGNGSYQDYNGPFDVTDNTTVYAYSTKENINSVEASHEINNIDKINPRINSKSVTDLTPVSVTMNIKGQDLESGLAFIKVYLSGNEVFSTNEYPGNDNTEKEVDVTISNLEQITTYTFVIEVIDKVGNTYQEELEVTTPAKHYVARTLNNNGEEIERYETLKEAIESNECVGACHIEMLDNVEETNSVLNGQDIKLDLNGFTITGLTDKAFENNGILQIVDYNDEEIGKIYSSGTAIVNTGKLIIGENEEPLVVSKTEPVIEGAVTGINSPGELHFYDGKIIGGATTGALKGTAPITPYLYNASVESIDNKEIATLEIMAEAEARINSVYYTKVQEAVDASKNGTYQEKQGSADILSQSVSTGNYRFIYDSTTNTLKSNNKGKDNSVANSYIKIDLTDSEVDKALFVDVSVSSQGNYDFGYVTITNSKAYPAYNQENGRILYLSGVNTDNVTTVLEKGKVYYVHLGYRKDGSYSSNDDEFIIKEMKLYDYNLANATELKDGIVSDGIYHLSKNAYGDYETNILKYNYILTTDSYVKIDNTGKTGDEVLYVDATYTSNSGHDNSYIIVSDSKDMPDRTIEDNRYTITEGRKFYEIHLKPDQVNYIHFTHYKGWTGSTNKVTIHSIKTEDEILKEHLNSDVELSTPWNFYEVNTEPNLWKDTSGNNKHAITRGTGFTYDSSKSGFNLSNNSYATVSGLTSDVLNTETVEIEFSTTSTANQLFYFGSSNERISVGIYNNYIIISNDSRVKYNTFEVPENLADGNKHTITVTFDNGQFGAYFDRLPMTKRTDITYYGGRTGTTFVGSRPNGSESLNGSLYSVKVFSDAYTEDEVADNDYNDENLLLNLDGTDPLISLEQSSFINNNQYQPETVAYAYMVFDLRNVSANKNIYVNAEISSQSSYDYGSIIVKSYDDTQDPVTYPSWNDAAGRFAFISGEVEAQDYTVTLTGGKVNYMFFCYRKDGATDSGKDTFKINNVRYFEDSNSPIPTYLTSNGTRNMAYNDVPVLNQDVDTVQILRNITMTNPLEIIETRDVILDLNGYTLTSSKDDYIIDNKGSLTIIDSDFDNQKQAAQSKYNRQIAEFNDEYTSRNQAKTDYYTDKQDEYDQEYQDQIDAAIEEKEEAEQDFNDMATDYLDYMNSEEYKAKTEFDFDYSGLEEVFLAPFTGTYKLETWGAQGGSVSDTYYGGYGGYSVGEIELNAGDRLYINVGGQGQGNCNSGTCLGGYNGGGYATAADGANYASGGGGATSISKKTGLLTNTEMRNNLVIVAGGGSGGYYHTNGTGYSTQGAAGGGIKGADGFVVNTYGAGGGGTQSAGGNAGFRGGAGSAGQGGNSTTGASGGGGGYFGGGAAAHDGAGGGSGYIASSDLTNKQMVIYSSVDGDKSSDPDTKTNLTTDVSATPESNYAKKGNGYAKISYIDSGSHEYTINDAKKVLKNYEKNYNYSGTYKEFTAPLTADYIVEAWGASGGTGYFSTQPTPGRGAYTKGTISLNKGEKIYIYVGGKGGNANSAHQVAPAGYNGGASGTTSTDGDDASGAGGGATDIRLVASDWDNAQSLASRIMVAGGGGGAHSTSTTSYTEGMDAGALSVTGQLSTWQHVWTPIVNQTQGGAFGYGTNVSSGHAGSGGGGGYYGGYTTIINGFSGRASGGSSYISGYTGSVAIQAEDNTNPKYGCLDGTTDIECSYHYSGKVFKDTTMAAGYDYMPTHDDTDIMIGNTGNGYARITIAAAQTNYDTPNEKYDDLLEDLDVDDYFDITSYKNSYRWDNVLNGNQATITGSITKETNDIRVNDIDARNYLSIPIDNTTDTIIYGLVKVNRNYNNSGASRIFEIYSGLPFSFNTPLVYALNNQLCVDSFNRSSCTSNVEFSGYNLITMTINNTTKMLRLYVNGNYMTEISYENYGDTLYLSHANNNDTASFGDNSFKMFAIGNSIPSDDTIKENSKKIMDFYTNDVDRLIVKKTATDEASDAYDVDDYIQDGLVLHYDGKNPGQEANVWQDTSGNDYNGTISNAVHSGVDGSYYFNGNSSVTLTNSPITIDNGETVSVLFRTSSRSNQLLYNGGSHQKIGIGTWDGYIIVSNNTSVATYDIPTNWDDNMPHIVTVIYKDGEYSAYFDNSPMIKRTNTNHFGNDANLYVGRRGTYGPNYYTGDIYDVKVYDKALLLDEITRNYNVDITRYNIDRPIIKRVPTMDSTSQNGKIVSTTYHTIHNEEGAFLNIKEAIVDVDKSGAYAVVDNYGTLTMENTGFLNALQQNNMGIYNAWYGTIIDGNGTITANGASSKGIVNESEVTDEFGGYIIVTNNTSAYGIYNIARDDVTYKNLNISGSGTGIYENSSKKLTVKDSTINSSNQNSVYSPSSSVESEIVLDNIRANSSIYNDSGSNRTITIKNSTLETDHSIGSQVTNLSKKVIIDKTNFISCAHDRVVNNAATAEIKDSTVEIPSTCADVPRISNGEPNATMTIDNLEFNKHNTAYDSNNNNGDRGLITNYIQSTMTITDGSINTDNYYPYAISNGGGVMTIKGEFETSDNFDAGIHNYTKSYWYHNYNPDLTIGEDDGEVSTTYPKIKGINNAILSQNKDTYASGGLIENKLYFYDGVLIGKIGDTLHSAVYDKPDNYDINVKVKDEKEEVTLKPENSTKEEDYVCRIGSTKYTTLQAAVNAAPNNTETEIVVIKDIETALNVNINSNKDIIINLNNHSIKPYNNEDFITNNGKLQIVDNSGEIVTKTNRYYNSSYINNNGTLILDDILLNPYYLDSYLLMNSGTSTINGGSLSTAGRTIYNDGILTLNNGSIIRTANNFSLVEGTENGEVTINDGYYENSGSTAMFDTGKKIDIHGGTFIPKASTVVNNRATSVATIDGGNFDATLRRSGNAAYDGKIIANAGTATITGITSNYNWFASNSGTLTLNDVEDNNFQKSGVDNTGSLYVDDFRSSSKYRSFYIHDTGDNEVELNNLTITDIFDSNGAVYFAGTNNDVTISNSNISGALGEAYASYGVLTFAEGSNTNLDIISSTIADLRDSKCNSFCKDHCGMFLASNTTGNINVLSGNISAISDGNAITNNGTAKITLGTEGGVPSKSSPRIEAKETGILNTNGNAIIDFYDGIVIGDVAISSRIGDVETGYEIITGQEGTKESKYLDKLYVIQNKTKIDALVDPTEAQINQYKYYTIQEGITAADNNDELEILRNYTSTPDTETITNTKTISIDLKGYKLIQNNETFISNNGTLTIKDTSTSGTGTIEDNSGLVINNSGTLNLVNTTISSTYKSITKMITNNANSSITIDGTHIYLPYGTIVDNYGSLVVNSGTLESTVEEAIGTTAYSLFINRTTGTMTINDGSFRHSGTAQMFHNQNSLTINDGFFKLYGILRFDNNDHSAYTTAVYTEAGAISNVLGGVFGDKTENASTYGNMVVNYGTTYIKDVYSDLGGGGYNNSTLTIEDSEFANMHEGSYYTYDRWNTYRSLFDEGGTLNITGTKFYSISNEQIIKSTNSQVFNIDDCIFEARRAILIKDDSNAGSSLKTINITNSTLTSTYETIIINNNKNTVVNITNDDITSSGTGLQVGTMLDANSSQVINLNGGSVTSTNGIAFNNDGNGIINIGTLGAPVSQTNPALTGTSNGFRSTNNNGTVNFYDGIITGTTAIQGTIDFIEPNYSIITTTSSGKESKYLDLTFAVENVTKIQTIGDLDTYRYYNIQDAIDNASNGDKLRVLRDITLLSTDSTITNSKEIIFDLNSYKITQNNSKFMVNSGTFTITDESQDKLGNIQSNTGTIIDNSGTFTMNNGTLYIPTNGIGDVVISRQNATMTVNGGKIYNYKSRIIDSSGSLTITGGEIYNSFAKDSIDTREGHNLIDVESTGSVSVTGGEFTYSGSGAILRNSGTATITGGVFKSRGGRFYSQGSWSYVMPSAVSNASTGTMNVTGGTYSSDLNYSRIIDNAGTATLTNISSTYNAVAYNSGTLTITGLTDTNISELAYCTSYGIYNEGQLYLIDSTIKGRYHILRNFNNMEITNSIIETSNLQALYASGSSCNTIINSGTFTQTGTNAAVISEKSSTITVENGTFTSNENTFYLSNEGYSQSGVVNVKKGTITSTAGNAVYIQAGTFTLGEPNGVPSITEPVISGKTYGIYHPTNSSFFNYYDGVITGETGSIYGTISDVEAGYKEKRDDKVNPDTGVSYKESTLTVIGDTERVAMVGSVNFLSLQAAVNYASNNSIRDIYMFKNVTLDSDLVKPDGGSNVVIYLNGRTIDQGNYNIDSGIAIDPGTAPGASISRFLANISGVEINPRNIVIYEMEDGSSLDANKTYKLYKEMDGVLKVVKVKENSIGNYDLGVETDILRTTRSRIYINGIGEGTYKLVGSDSKEITFTISYTGVSSNIRENNNINGSRVSTAVATLVLSLQTGVVRNPYILVIMLLIIVTLGFIAFQKYKKEDYQE